NAVYWSTGIDPAAGRRDLKDSDPERQSCAALVAGWHEVQTALEVKGMTSATLLKKLGEKDNAEKFNTIRSALSDLWPKVKPGELPSSGSIGMKIQAIRGKSFDGKRFEAIEAEKRAKVWGVVNGESSESNES